MRPTRFSPMFLLLTLAACGQADGPTATRPIAPTTFAADIDVLCADCAFGPETFNRSQGQPNLYVRNFSATAGAVYTIDLDDLGTEGDGTVSLNGSVILEKRAVTGVIGPRHITLDVALQASNVLEIRLTGKKGTQLNVTVTEKPVEADCFPNLPAPMLVVEGAAIIFGRNTYDFNVTNSALFPDALFAESPELPPCGINTSAARSWVDLYNTDTNVRLSGYCALDAAVELNTLVLSVPTGSPAPRAVYLKIRDRKCDIEYRSNDVVLPTVIIQ